SKTAALIGLKKVDAIIGWDVFSRWNPDTTEIVYLEPEQIPRLAYVPAAISTYSRDRQSAQEFIDFLVSRDGQAIFARWGYIATEEEARRYAPEAQIGGEYKLPADYQPSIE
ncbi:MAG TPA: molybdate ABC transporter substrate-binding protein, partial [Anaerolineae bacterium]|nr:molybdate ABC transporter substrate-binding protein [Anaerolineae bacterium]